MKQDFWTQLRRPAPMSWRGITMAIVPTLMWLVGVSVRPTALTPYCAVPETAPCASADVNSLDRIGMGIERPDADGWSNRGQTVAVVASVAVPLVVQLARVATRSLSPIAASLALGEDLLLMTQTIAWNGAATEAFRLASGRPRPFVYMDPQERGKDPAHYVSFYSGHTSFVAATLMGLILILFARGASSSFTILVGVTLQCALMITAFGRVLSARHFITDTLAGAAAGLVVALLVASYARRLPPAS